MVFIACREGILRDHLQSIVADIKFLTRQAIPTTLFHNMSNRFANQKHFKRLAQRLPDTTIVRVPPESDFYHHVLDAKGDAVKLIFLERKCLIDHQGRRINTLTTASARQEISTWGDLITNENLRGVLARICQAIDSGVYRRVHILPAGRHSIKNELFSVEGSGTLIANDFTEAFCAVTTQPEADVVSAILDLYKGEKYLKPRTRTYIQTHRNQFYVTKIDGIIVGCVEKKHIDEHTVELGALAISTKFRNQRVGLFTIQAFVAEMGRQGYTHFISLTNNPRLAKLFKKQGFVQKSPSAYRIRQLRSPAVRMYFK